MSDEQRPLTHEHTFSPPGRIMAPTTDEQRPPTHEEVEAVIEDAPSALLERLPDSCAREQAIWHLEEASKHAHRAVEVTEKDVAQGLVGWRG